MTKAELKPKGQETPSRMPWSLITGLCGFFAQSFPGVAYFINHAPPFFPSMGIFISVIGIAIFLWGYYSANRRSPPLYKVVGIPIIAIILLIVYVIMFQYFTVSPPGNRVGSRRQIGFYMFDWSLTEKAKSKINELPKKEPPIEVNTPNALMNIFGVWGGEGRTDEIWHIWSIITAGIILSLFFLVGLCSWAYGIGVLARYVAVHKLR